MSFFGSRPKAQSVLLIDIASSSIAGAYARVVKGGPAIVFYSTRLQIPEGSGPASSTHMLRTLDALLLDLQKNGAPLLRRRTGSGSVQDVYVHVGAPWQHTDIRVITFKEEKPFIFSEQYYDKAKKSIEVPPESFHLEQSIVGTVINGYTTANPLGKKALRAEVIVLDSVMDAELAKLVRASLQSFSPFHTLQFVSLSTLVAHALSYAFPHEKDYWSLRVTESATELFFVKNGFPRMYASIPSGLGAFARVAKERGFQSFPDGGNALDVAQNQALDTKLADVARRFTSAIIQRLYEYTNAQALPRTLFLVTDSEAAPFIQKTLDVPDMHALWLSDDPLAVLSLETKHFKGTIGYELGAEEDSLLSLLALRACK